MAKFVFRLQSYLDIKEKLEEQKRNEYGFAMSVVEKEKQKKREIVKRKTESIYNLKSSMADKIDVMSLRKYNNYIDALKIKEKKQEKVVEDAVHVADEKRSELIERMRERKTLDILKEKSHIEFLKEEQRAEQKMVDEIVSFKYSDKEDSYSDLTK